MWAYELGNVPFNVLSLTVVTECNADSLNSLSTNAEKEEEEEEEEEILTDHKLCLWKY